MILYLFVPKIFLNSCLMSCSPYHFTKNEFRILRTCENLECRETIIFGTEVYKKIFCEALGFYQVMYIKKCNFKKAFLKITFLRGKGCYRIVMKIFFKLPLGKVCKKLQFHKLIQQFHKLRPLYF